MVGFMGLFHLNGFVGAWRSLPMGRFCVNGDHSKADEPRVLLLPVRPLICISRIRIGRRKSLILKPFSASLSKLADFRSTSSDLRFVALRLIRSMSLV